MRSQKFLLLYTKMIFLIIGLLSFGCSTQELSNISSNENFQEYNRHFMVKQPFYSSRDYVAISSSHLTWDSLSVHDDNVNSRDPSNDCFSSISNFFFRKKPAKNTALKNELPLLSGLDYENKKGPKKDYIDYWANPKILKSLPEYEDFLEKSVEIIFTPHEPFGHVRLRVGKRIYGFENLQWTTTKDFIPTFHISNDKSLPSSMGAVFLVGSEKIKAVQQEIEQFYKHSASNNFPPFDAYSSLLRIDEKENPYDGVKRLFFHSDAPKYGNNNEVLGKIIEKNGGHYLISENNYEFEIQKKGNQYFSTSYSCSSSAGFILEKYFQITIHGSISAKNTMQSIQNLNAWGNTQPDAIMRYYEKE